MEHKKKLGYLPETSRRVKAKTLNARADTDNLLPGDANMNEIYQCCFLLIVSDKFSIACCKTLSSPFR